MVNYKQRPYMIFGKGITGLDSPDIKTCSFSETFVWGDENNDKAIAICGSLKRRSQLGRKII